MVDFSKFKKVIWVAYAIVIFNLGGCSATAKVSSIYEQHSIPDVGKTLLIMGQDLDSIREYSRSECCPVPAGVTTYLGIYDLLDEDKNYGGIGIDPNGKPLDYYADWGGGKASLYSLMQEYPGSAIAIGLSMTENKSPGNMQKLIKGEYDQEIRHLAELMAKHAQPIYLRVAYEFDGIWNHGYEKHDQYIAAYRHVVDVVRSSGASQVSFVWQACSSPTDDSIEGERENIKDWYPGDEYVDWMGLSWFLQPYEIGKLADFTSTQHALADEVLAFARAQNKPVMVAESAPVGYDLKRGYRALHSHVWDGAPHTDKKAKSGEQIWNEWYVPYFQYIHKNNDVIKAVAYINSNWDSQSMWSGDYQAGYWGDSRLQENTFVLNQWLKEVVRESWIFTVDDLNKHLNYPK